MNLYRNQYLRWQSKVNEELEKGTKRIILSVGRKGRKTTLCINELFTKALLDTQGLTYPYIGPTRLQAKEIVWDDHVANALNECRKEKVEYRVNNSELSVKFPGHGKFVVDGGDNIDSLRGKSDWGMIVLDEFPIWRNKRYAWEEVVEPNLAVHDAPSLICGTPKGYDYFHRLMKMGDHRARIEGEAFDEEKQIVKPLEGYTSFRFTSYDNPFLDRKWLEAKRLTLSPAAFRQEYLARFEKFTGLIYKEFDRNVHVIEPFEIPAHFSWYRCMDFGGTNPTVCLWIALDHRYDTLYVVDEYCNAGQSTEFHAGVIKGKSVHRPIVATFGDPSATQSMMDYAGYGVMIAPARKIYSERHDWVLSGIKKIQSLLLPASQTKKPRLYVFKNCTTVIKEFESYRWAETLERNVLKDVPLKENDHCMDALRYLIVSYEPRVAETEEEEARTIAYNRFTGY